MKLNNYMHTNEEIRKEFENILRNEWGEDNRASEAFDKWIIDKIITKLQEQKQTFFNQKTNAHDQEVRKVLKQQMIEKVKQMSKSKGRENWEKELHTLGDVIESITNY